MADGANFSEIGKCNDDRERNDNKSEAARRKRCGRREAIATSEGAEPKKRSEEIFLVIIQ